MISVGLMIMFWLFAPLYKPFSYPYNLIGIALFLFGMGMAFLIAIQFKQVGTNIRAFQKPDILVTNGLFSISRNPIYLGFVIALVGVALTLNNLSSLFVAAAYFVIADRWYIPSEETAMAEQFGDQYENYKQRTRRWL